MQINPQFPVVTDERRQSLLEIKQTLEAQAPKGAAPDPFQQQADSADGKRESADEQRTEPASAGTGGDGTDPLPVS
jgi:hypothetical protein